MNPPITDAVLKNEFHTSELIPPAWFRVQPAGPFSVYNPALTFYRGRLLMAYRVDFGYERPFRVATAVCALDERLRVVPESVVALSDSIPGEGVNHYDARFLEFRNRLFVHYHNDWNTVPNQISLVELDRDTLQARSAARPLWLEGSRQPCEKNWMLFEHQEELFAVYQIDPHIVLHLDLQSSGPVCCRPIYRSEWDTTKYSRRYGIPRGGTPPVRLGERYVAVFHSRTVPARSMNSTFGSVAHRINRFPWWSRLKRRLREGFAPVRYYGGVYEFGATPPFTPTFIGSEPVLSPALEKGCRRATASHMAPRRVVFPCGLVRLGQDRWLVSYGLNDQRCILRVLSLPNITSGAQAKARGALP